MRRSARTSLGIVLLVSVLCPVVVARVEAATLRVDVDVRASDVTSRPVDGTARIEFPGAHALRHVGQPELPALLHEFVVGSDRSVTRAELVGGEWVRLPMGAPPREVEPLVPSEARGTAEEVVFDPTELATATVYPPVTARMVGDRTWHGRRVVSIPCASS